MFKFHDSTFPKKFTSRQKNVNVWTCLKQTLCEGDSGGPYVVKENGRWTQLGVTSSGEGCGYLPGIFMNVQKFSNWVAEHVDGEEILTHDCSKYTIKNYFDTNVKLFILLSLSPKDRLWILQNESYIWVSPTTHPKMAW